jgi:hypothetical protein
LNDVLSLGEAMTLTLEKVLPWIKGEAMVLEGVLGLDKELTALPLVLV